MVNLHLIEYQYIARVSRWHFFEICYPDTPEIEVKYKRIFGAVL
jgi:hypothetical protein